MGVMEEGFVPHPLCGHFCFQTGAGMLPSFAILLDAGFLRCKLGTSRNPVSAETITAFAAESDLSPIR